EDRLEGEQVLGAIVDEEDVDRLGIRTGRRLRGGALLGVHPLLGGLDRGLGVRRRLPRQLERQLAGAGGRGTGGRAGHGGGGGGHAAPATRARVASRCAMAWIGSTSAPATRRSAAEGMMALSAVSGSCTMATPPRSAMQCRPRAPSSLAPVSTTPMVRAP